MITPDWIQQPRRVFQHLLRETDAIGLTARRVVEEALEMGADTYLCMGGGFSAWYRTKVLGYPVSPHLGFDFVGEVTEEARKQGLRVLVRMDISKS